MEAHIRKDRKETIYKQAQSRKKFLEIVGVVLVSILLLGSALGLFYFLYVSYNG